MPEINNATLIQKPIDISDPFIDQSDQLREELAKRGLAGEDVLLTAAAPSQAEYIIKSGGYREENGNVSSEVFCLPVSRIDETVEYLEQVSDQGGRALLIVYDAHLLRPFAIGIAELMKTLKSDGADSTVVGWLKEGREKGDTWSFVDSTQWTLRHLENPRDAVRAIVPVDLYNPKDLGSALFGR